MGSTPTYISGSRAASILGLDSFKSRVNTALNILEEITPGYCDKNGYELPPKKDSAFLRWGLGFEDAICKKIAELEGVPVTNRELELTHPNLPFVTCHIDGIIEKDGVRILDENKTTSAFVFRDEYGDELGDIIPVKYTIQTQHNMLLTDCDKCFLYVLVFPVIQSELDKACDLEKIDTHNWLNVLFEMGQLKKFVINADKKIQKDLITEYKTFWDNFISKGEVPDPEYKSDLKMLCPQKTGECITTPEIFELLNEVADINGEISKVKKRKEKIDVKVVDFMRKNVKTADDCNNMRILSKTGKKLASWTLRGGLRINIKREGVSSVSTKNKTRNPKVKRRKAEK